MRKKRFFAGLMASLVAMSSLQITTFADTVNGIGTGTADTNFSSNDMFAGDLVVLIPDDITLELNQDGDYLTGNGIVTAYGVAPTSKMLTVTTNPSITYKHSKDASIKVGADVTFGSSCTAIWSGEVLRSNVSATDKVGYDVTANVTVEDIDDIGTYNSEILFDIELGDFVYYMGYNIVDDLSYIDNDDSLPYNTYLNSSDTLIELQGFSMSEQELVDAGYDVIVSSTESSLVVPSEIENASVIGVSLDELYSNEEISSYVKSVYIPHSVDGLELANTTGLTSDTNVYVENSREAVYTGKNLPADSELYYCFSGAENFCYFETTYTAPDGTVYEGYAVNGFSQAGIQALYDIKYNNITGNVLDDIVIVLPETYNGKPVISFNCVQPNNILIGCEDYYFGMAIEDYQYYSNSFTKADKVADCISNITLVCGDNIKEIYGVHGSIDNFNTKTYLMQNIKEIVINDGALEISYQAFRNISCLNSITIPASVQKIGDSAFANSTDLSKIILEDGFNGTLGYSVFTGCYALTEQYIPSSMTSIHLDSWADTSIGSFVIDNNYADVTVSDTNIVQSNGAVVEFKDVAYIGSLQAGAEFDGYERGNELHITSDDCMNDYLSGSLSWWAEEVFKVYASPFNTCDTLVLDEGVTQFGDYITYINSSRPSSITTLKLPSTFTTINSDDLANTNVNKVVFNNNYEDVTITGTYFEDNDIQLVFNNGSALGSIDDTLTDCKYFVLSCNDTYASLEGRKNSISLDDITTITIPASYKNLPITCIRSLGNIQGITCIELPTGLEKLHSGAFVRGTNITSVVYNGVTYTNKTDLALALHTAGVKGYSDEYIKASFFSETGLAD